MGRVTHARGIRAANEIKRAAALRPGLFDEAASLTLGRIGESG
jgi:hypothetical protein